MASKARASARHSHASHAAMTRTTFHPGIHAGASGATHRRIEVENQGRNAERGPKHEPRHHCVHNTQLPLPQHCPLDISIGQQPACKGGTQRHDARPSPQNNSRRDILSNGGEVVAMNQQRCHFGRVAERVPDRIRCTQTHTHTHTQTLASQERCSDAGSAKARWPRGKSTCRTRKSPSLAWQIGSQSRSRPPSRTTQTPATQRPALFFGGPALPTHSCSDGRVL